MSSHSSSSVSGPDEPSRSPEAKVGQKRKRELSPASYWKMKKKEKREGRKMKAAERKKELNEEWSLMTEGEREEKKLESQQWHKKKEERALAAHNECVANLGSDKTPTIGYDVSFQHLMNEKQIRSTLSQLKLSHSILKGYNFPLKPCFFIPKESTEITSQLEGYEGFKKYPPLIRHEHWSDAFPTDKIVFLTADSPTVLTKLESGTAYIIGGFVDHNSKKGFTYELAKNYGVATARLPIDETLQGVGQLCRVLTINHMTEVLSIFATTGDWKAAFEVLPTRRQQK